MSTHHLVLACAVLLTACTAQAPSEPAATPAQDTPLAASPSFKPDVSLNQMMVSIVDHNSHIVWDAAEKPPTTPEEWEALESAAVSLAAGGNLTMVSGNGVDDRRWTAQPNWAVHSQALTDAGLVTLQAVQSKSPEALVKAGDQLVLSCISCHREYRLVDSKIHAKEK